MSTIILKGLRSRFLVTKGYQFAIPAPVVEPHHGILSVSDRSAGSVAVSDRAVGSLVVADR